ncbi:YceI family protein [Parafilimonas sp.]|uniref:YceI family protein n=1 Tax=Parafilimonas sp. TaxID=1969739 RepID=UPI0039E72088
MMKNKALASFIVGIMLMASGFAQPVLKTKWIVLNNASVRVNGSTNVNKFSCLVNGYFSLDTITCYKNGNVTALHGKLAIPVTSFDCMNAMMTSELRKTLKAKEFATLNINFISLNKYPALKPEQESINGIVTIELAGVTRKFEVNYKISMDAGRVIHMTGVQSIHFSDFKLTPPRKLGGMIKADDKLEVMFQINFSMAED